LAPTKGANINNQHVEQLCRGVDSLAPTKGANTNYQNVAQLFCEAGSNFKRLLKLTFVLVVTITVFTSKKPVQVIEAETLEDSSA
jgi:hypothetical protein